MGGIGARRMLVGGIARFVKRGGLRTLFAVVALLATACGSPTTLDTPTPAPTGTPPSPNAKAPLTSLAAGQALAFRRLTLDDGLSQSTINCITQDPQGFMWFGTQDGLNRYDGYEFRIYRRDAGNPYSLTNSYIVGCEHDQRGVMWVVTGDGTLHRYEPETDRFIRAKLALDDPFEQRGSEFTFLHGDAQGRVWIGTWGDGLARYDPDEDSFTIYRHDPDDVTSLSHRIVTQIYEGRDGTIWVGTEGGLNRWDPASDSFVRYPYRDFPPDSYQYDPPVHVYDPMLQPDNPHALASPAVTALLEDREGTLWVGTRYGGLNRLDRETDRFTAYSFDPAYEPKDPNTLSGNSVRALLEDHVGHIWVASAHYNLDQTRTMARLGLEQLDPQTGAVTRYRGNPEDPCSLPHDAVMRMYEDRRGILWVHTFAGGVELYDRAGGCFHHQAHDPEDPRTLGDEGITRFYEDASGGLWIGTELGGVSYYDPTWCKFPHYPVSAPGGERLSNNSIWVIAASPPALDAGGRTAALWISTFAGLNYWDRRSNAFTFYELDPELPDTVAHGIYEDASRQRLWLGTTMGLERAGLQSDGATAPKTLDITRVLTRSSASVGYVMDLHSTGDDLLWLAHYRVGLSRFDLETETVVATYQADPDDTDGLFDDRIIDIHPGRGGTLWLVTQSGVEHFDPERETFTHYLHDPQQPDGMAQRVISLYQDEAGNVWLGSDGEGLQRLDPDTGQVTATYHAAHGLPNNVVYSILPDNAGNLWLSTNKGLARFDPETETFRTYTVDDGLQSNEFNMGADFRAPDGELFFGGINGINAFYPQAIGRNEHPPRVVITEITRGALQAPGATAQGGHAASTATEDSVAETAPPMVRQIELTYHDRIVSFAFAALHYTVPEHNAYAYMLEGFDEDWYYVGNRRFATYTNLPPGRYTFRVKAANSDGVWNEEGTAVAVNVKPPFWATWWFRGTLGLLVVGAAVAGYRVRVGSIEARSRELAQQVAERTKELAAVNAIAAVVSRSLDLDEVLAAALDKTLEVMGIEAGGIYLLDSDGTVLNIAAHQGFGPDLVREIDRLDVGEGFSGRVVASGETLVVPDISQDPRLTRLAMEQEGLHSLAVVPIRAKGEILGTLFAVTRGYREFTQREVQLLASIGDQIGVAVENAGLYEDTRRRLAQLTALQETAMAVASTLELDRLLRLIIRQATDLLEAGGGILNLVDWETETDRVLAAEGSAAGIVGQSSSLYGSLSGWAALHREPVVSNELEADPRVDHRGLRLLESEKAQPIRSAAVVPLMVKDKVLGTLVLIDKHKGMGTFDQGDLDLLQAFANQAATAIENARLFEDEQRRAEQFRVLSEVGRRTTSILSTDELLKQMALLIQEGFAYDVVEIGLIEGEELVFRAGVGRSPGGEFQSFRVLVGQEGVTGVVAATGNPLLVPDVTHDSRFVQFSDTDTRSELAVPIKTQDKVIGVLNVQSAQLDAFDESDLAVMQALADQAGTAIVNARLFEAEQRRAEQFRVISEVGSRITSILDVDELLDQLAKLIQQAFGYYHVGIGLVEEDKVSYRVGAGALWDNPEFRFEPAQFRVGKDGLTGWVAGTGEPLLVPDVNVDPRYIWMRPSETRSELVVPLKVKGEVMGVLDIQSNQLNAFDESDLLVVQSLAHQAAIAIENARLYEQASRLAVIEERQRLARELHDSVTQALYGVSLYAEAAARQLGSGAAESASAYMRDVRDTAQEALREMRLLIFELRPSVLESEGLAVALQTRLESVEERAGLGVTFSVEGEAPLPADIEEGLYRIAREALNNALKHAAAHNVSVTLDQGEEHIVLEIVDDGVGFDSAAAVQSGGLGLEGMAERATQMGGDLSVESEPGLGTRVRVEVTVDRTAPRAIPERDRTGAPEQTEEFDGA